MSVSQDGMKNIIITVVLLAEDVGKVNVGLIIYGKIKPSNIFFGGNYEIQSHKSISER